MSAATKIEWTDRSWNPVRGCSRISPGCENCYAERQAGRFSGEGWPFHGYASLTSAGSRWTRKVSLIPDALEEPLHWKKPQRIFVNSMSDLFHEDLPFEHIAQVFEVMIKARWHTFQILTKRAARLVEFRDWWCPGRFVAFPDNVWIGVSVEDQARADERIPFLLQTPAVVRFLSCEPLLGPVTLCAGEHPAAEPCWLDRKAVGWVIVGGESGPGARPMRLDWAQRIVDDCRAAGVAVFCKQLGAKPVEFLTPLKLKDRKGGDPSEWPQSLAVREFPEVR